jgi:hypothetical protein
MSKRLKFHDRLPLSSFQRKLESSDLFAERHWIDQHSLLKDASAFAGMTSVGAPPMTMPSLLSIKT